MPGRLARLIGPSRTHATTVGRSGRRQSRLPAFAGVMIALVSVVGSLAGYLYSARAEAAQSQRAVAENFSVRALTEAQRSQQEADIELGTFVRWSEQATAEAYARLAALTLVDGERDELTREADLWRDVADATLRLTKIQPGDEWAPRRDPLFPARYLAAESEQTIRLDALRDAANEDAARFEEQAASYTVAIALIAVSLYLFGLALAVRSRDARQLFVGVGVVLAGTAAMVVLSGLAAPDEVTPVEAADHYARARVAMLSAHDVEDYRAAVAHFDLAIALRPRFARAYVERATAIYAGETVAQPGVVAVPESPDAVRAARLDLEMARRLGLDNHQVVGSLAFYMLVEGVLDGDRQLIGRAGDLAARAVAHQPDEIDYHFNLAASLLAADRPDAANFALDAALALMFERAPDQRILWDLYAARILTHLEMIVRGLPDRVDAVRAAKERVVASITAGSVVAPQSTGVVLNDVVVDVFPVDLQWVARLDGYDAERDRVAVYWYYQAPGRLGWSAIPYVSGAVDPALGTSGEYFSTRSYMTAFQPARCAEDGSYRAEFYVNGTQVGTFDAQRYRGSYVGFSSAEIGLATCYPSGWQPIEQALPGLFDGYVSPDATHGVYLLRFGAPRSWAAVDGVSALVVDAMVHFFAERFPGEPVYLEDAGTTSEYFLGLSDPAWRWYDYGSGFVRAAAGMGDDGVAFVAAVYGPHAWWEGGEPFEILSSTILIE